MILCDICAAEGYPFNEETCKDCEYNPKNRESEEDENKRERGDIQG